VGGGELQRGGGNGDGGGAAPLLLWRCARGSRASRRANGEGEEAGAACVHFFSTGSRDVASRWGPPASMPARWRPRPDGGRPRRASTARVEGPSWASWAEAARERVGAGAGRPARASGARGVGPETAQWEAPALLSLFFLISFPKTKQPKELQKFNLKANSVQGPER
jgi:hypothetical protein